MQYGSAQSQVLLAQNEAQLRDAIAHALDLARQAKQGTLIQLLTMVQLELRMKSARISNGELKRFCEVVEARQGRPVEVVH